MVSYDNKLTFDTIETSTSYQMLSALFIRNLTYKIADVTKYNLKFYLDLERLKSVVNRVSIIWYIIVDSGRNNYDL